MVRALQNSLQLTISTQDQDKIITTALGSMQNAPSPRLDRWISETITAYHHYEAAAVEADRVLEELSEKNLNFAQQYIEETSFPESLAGKALFRAEENLFKKFLEVLDDLELSKEMFGEAINPQLLAILLKLRVTEFNNAEMIEVHPEAFTEMLIQLKAGLQINVEDYINVIEVIPHEIDDSGTSNRIALLKHKFSQTPGFSDHSHEAHPRAQPYGDRYLHQRNLISTISEDRPALRALTLVPPFLRPFSPYSGQTPGRYQFSQGFSTYPMIRASKANQPMLIPQSAEDWMARVTFFPIVLSFSPGVRLLHTSASLVPAFQWATRALMLVPSSLILMFSGINTLTSPNQSVSFTKSVI